MYLVGHLTRAHGNEPPQWEVFALRRTKKRAMIDCLEGKIDEGRALFYLALHFGIVPNEPHKAPRAVFPRRA